MSTLDAVRALLAESMRQRPLTDRERAEARKLLDEAYERFRACGRCDGTGTVRPVGHLAAVCPVCDGTGRRPR